MTANTKVSKADRQRLREHLKGRPVTNMSKWIVLLLDDLDTLEAAMGPDIRDPLRCSGCGSYFCNGHGGGRD